MSYDNCTNPEKRICKNDKCTGICITDSECAPFVFSIFCSLEHRCVPLKIEIIYAPTEIYSTMPSHVNFRVYSAHNLTYNVTFSLNPQGIRAEILGNSLEIMSFPFLTNFTSSGLVASFMVFDSTGQYSAYANASMMIVYTSSWSTDLANKMKNPFESLCETGLMAVLPSLMLNPWLAFFFSSTDAVDLLFSVPECELSY